MSCVYANSLSPLSSSSASLSLSLSLLSFFPPSISLAPSPCVKVSEKVRKLAYKTEMERLAEMATTLMENMSDKPSTFTSATHVEHIRAMFKVWPPGAKCCLVTRSRQHETWTESSWNRMYQPLRLDHHTTAKHSRILV